MAVKSILRLFSKSVKPVLSDQEEDENITYTVVLTGGKMSKSLHLARCLKAFERAAAGVKVNIIMLEQRKFNLCASRFSKCVDKFEEITSPRESPDVYMDGIYDACMKYRATHFLPVAAPVEAVYDAKLKNRLESKGVQVLHMNSELCDILDDKHRFGTFLTDLGIGCPRTFQVDNEASAHEFNKKFNAENLKMPFVLKNLTYDPIHRLDLFTLPTTEDNLEAYLRKIEKDGNPITPEEPWQLQEFLNGPEYAAMIFVRDNQLMGITACPSSPSQLNYVHEEIPAIRTWVNEFLRGVEAAGHNLTGQLCFDFIVVGQGSDQVAYPIECNPRVHTQCTSFNTERCTAWLGSLILEPNEKRSMQLAHFIEEEYNGSDLNVYWLYNEWFKILPNSWLLAYNPDDDIQERVRLAEQPITFSLQKLIALIVFLPAFLITFTLYAPVLALLMVSALTSTRRSKSLSLTGHAKVIVSKFSLFLDRLAHMSTNIEPDFCIYDPFPLFAKNHIQVPSRLLATIRTGVEWKKIDFAIGKVVEVGGD